MAATAVLALPAWAAAEPATISLSANCTSATLRYSGFPRGHAEELTQVLRVNGIPRLSWRSLFTGSGPEAFEHEVPVTGTRAGANTVSVSITWREGAVRESRLLRQPVSCPAAPGIHVEALQRLSNTSSFTTSPLVAYEGQTVEYEFFVADTGNTRLKLGAPKGEHPDLMTGGATELRPEGVATFRTSHHFSAEDAAAGSFLNRFQITGTPPPKEGSAITATSNWLEASVSPIVAEPE